MKNIRFTEIDSEILILNASAELIQKMVNKMLFTKIDDETGSRMSPRDPNSQKLFNIYIVEFLSAAQEESKLCPRTIPHKHLGYLTYLLSVCDNPQINPSNVQYIRKPVKNFTNWLNTECVVERFWSSTGERELDFHIKRFDFLRICGDISKHGFIRLDKRVEKLIKVFKKNKIEITYDEGVLLLPEFYDWFHNDVLDYHTTTIAEYLNNIYWGIYRYCEVMRNNEFVPDNLTRQLARSMYYELKGRYPIFDSFNTTQSLRGKY